jgi:hypothetical protein
MGYRPNDQLEKLFSVLNWTRFENTQTFSVSVLERVSSRSRSGRFPQEKHLDIIYMYI